MKKLMNLLAAGAMVALVAALIVACAGSAARRENEANKALAQAEEAKAESSTANISELPLGFYFGMTSEQADENIAALLQRQEISSTQVASFKYNHITASRDTIPFYVDLGFHEDELYRLIFSIQYGNQEDHTNLLRQDLIARLDSAYTHAGWHEAYFEDALCSFDYWIKENQIIFLRNAAGADLNYINAPVDKIVHDELMNKGLAEARARAEKRAESGATHTVAEDCLAGSSQEALKELSRHSSRSDEAAIREMVASGRAAILKRGTSVRLESSNVVTSTVEVLDGPYSGMTFVLSPSDIE